MSQETGTLNETKRDLTSRSLREARILWLAVTGKPISGIARETGLSRPWVSQIVHRPAAQALLAEMFAEAQKELRNRLPDLVRVALDFAERQMRHLNGYDTPAKTNLAFRIIELAAKAQCCQNCSINQNHGG